MVIDNNGENMKFSKKLKVMAIGLILSLASSTQIKCDEVEQVKKNTAKLAYQHPYIPGAMGALAFTKFFKATAFKRFVAFSMMAITGSLLSQSYSEKYLKNNLNCFEWATFKTPTFKAKTEELKLKIKNLFS